MWLIETCIIEAPQSFPVDRANHAYELPQKKPWPFLASSVPNNITFFIEHPTFFSM
jgi:hypothetical protein